MYDNCKKCNIKMNEHISAMFEAPYLDHFCENCIDILNKKIEMVTHNMVQEFLNSNTEANHL